MVEREKERESVNFVQSAQLDVDDVNDDLLEVK